MNFQRLCSSLGVGQQDLTTAETAQSVELLESKMALCCVRLTDDIFNSQRFHTPCGLHNSLVVYPNPENKGIAVGISLLPVHELIYAIS